MTREVYRSFEGKLDVDNQNGYIITETDNSYEIEFLSVWQGSGNGRARIKKEFLNEEDFANLQKISDLIDDIDKGRKNAGQIMYKNRWYSGETIQKIQNDQQDYLWKKYV